MSRSVNTFCLLFRRSDFLSASFGAIHHYSSHRLQVSQRIPVKTMLFPKCAFDNFTLPSTHRTTVWKMGHEPSTDTLHRYNEICEQLIFANIVHPNNMLNKHKCEHFQSIVGSYFAKQICTATVYKKLFTSVKGYLDNAHRADLQVRKREVVESLTLLKCIIQSCIFARARRNMGLRSLKDSLLKAMLFLTSMLTMDEVFSSTKEEIFK